MKYLNGKYYVEVKDKKYKIHLSENIILREREEPKSLRTQYQVQNDAKIRRNQHVIKDDKGKLTVKPYPKKRKNHCIVIEMQWLNMMLNLRLMPNQRLDEYYQCEVCDIIMNKNEKKKCSNLKNFFYSFAICWKKN